MVVIKWESTMREYILTSHEREIVETFLETGLHLNGFAVLKIRAKRALPRLEEDLRLLKRFLEKVNSETA